MAERLTYSGTKEAKSNVTIKDVTDKLAHYEDLEEAGRLIIVPESFNVKTAVECITEKFCPSTFGLNNYCGHYDCKGCWEAALKGADE